MNTIPQNRNTVFDFLKGIAVLLMIQVHIIELFANKEIFDSTAGHVSLFFGGAPVAPLFLIIFGHLLASSNKTKVELIQRGLKIFLIGMLLNCCLNLNLIISVTKGIYKIDLLPYIFGIDILHLAGMSLIFIALLKKVLYRNIFVTIAFICAILLLSQLLSYTVIENQTLKFISSFIWGSTTWSYFPLFPWLAYPLVGIAFYQLNQKYSFNFFNSTKIKLAIALAFMIFIFFTFQYALTTSSNLTIYYHHNFFFFAWVIVFLSYYSLLLKDINKLNKEFVIGKYIRWLGKNVTIIYIIQWLLIGNIATEIYRTISSPIKLGLYFFTMVTISSILTLLFIKIKDRIINNQK